MIVRVHTCKRTLLDSSAGLRTIGLPARRGTEHRLCVHRNECYQQGRQYRRIPLHERDGRRARQRRLPALRGRHGQANVRVPRPSHDSLTHPKIGLENP